MLQMGGKSAKMQSAQHSMMLREEIVTKERQKDLDNLGIAKTAREEKIRARDTKPAQAVKKSEEKEVGSFGD